MGTYYFYKTGDAILGSFKLDSGLFGSTKLC